MGLDQRPLGSIEAVGEPGSNRVNLNITIRKPNTKLEVDNFGVITISRECFERCCSIKKPPPHQSNPSFATLRTLRPTLLCFLQQSVAPVTSVL